MAAYEVARDLDLPDETVQLLHRLTDEFFESHPDSEIFRRMQFDDVEELVGQLRQQLEPGAAQLEDFTKQVHRARLPYGMLSATTGRPYAEALLRRAAGVLLIVSPDAEAKRREVEVAQRLLDGRAVVDASFLHTMALIPNVWAAVFGALRTLEITDVSLHDVLEAQQTLALRATGSMSWDAQAGRPILTEISEEQAELLATRAAWMADEARTKADTVSWRRLQSFPDFELNRYGPWLTPLDLAASEELAVLADDYPLRSLATSMGIPACGSVAVMRVLEHAGQLSASAVESALAVLRKNRGVDFPIDANQMRILAADDDDGRAACLLDLSRQAFWSDLSVATACFVDLLDVLSADENWAASAVHAATVGVIRAAT